MQRHLFAICLVLATLAGFGQILEPAKWKHSTSTNEVEVGAEIDLIFTATIDANWYLYSSDFDPDLGPMVTEFNFNEDDSYQLVGEIRPINPKEKYDSIFEGNYTYFKGTGEFRQTIKVLSADLRITGSYSYQVCSDIDGKCIPFEEDFEFTDFRGGSSSTLAQETSSPLASPFANTGSPIGGQLLHPAEWTWEASQTSLQTGDEVELIFLADIDDDWYLYSSDFDPDLGPQVTRINFVPHPSYELVGDLKPINPKEKYDSIFEGNYTYFNKRGEFRQKIRVLSADLTITGNYEYQVCSDIDGKCIPFDEGFEFTGLQVSGERVSPTAAAVSLTVRDSNDPYSLLAFMLFAFLAGLAAILTPCVFPMIPVTVTFFTKGANSKSGKVKALFYGVAIVLIYSLIGVGVSVVFGAEVANDIATSATANLIFFAFFVLFGLSFLGLFDINLPNSWVNKADTQADKGGYIGVIFMALTLVLVSFSCTGPIVGSILVESAGGAFVKPLLGMFAFSMAFAIPFTLFAFFPGWLNSLPKSGGWLNSVKVVLGFVELALSLKFLSIADQVYHWNLLDREVFLAIWIVILVMLGFYLLGKIRMPHDDELKVVSVPRMLLAIATFSFVVYLVPGMFGAPLKALAGYLPPITTHDFDVPSLIRQNSGGGSLMASEQELCDEPKYAEFLKFPHGIRGYFDYQQAIACAREQNKPLFIDFTGHGCVNCREMEARVWSDPEVLRRLKNDFVVVALYVDDRMELPEQQWYTSDYDGKVKKTIGKQNADFQISKFNNNAQPFYVILNHQEQLLMDPTAYNLDVGDFVKFLDDAKDNFENKNSVATN